MSGSWNSSERWEAEDDEAFRRLSRHFRNAERWIYVGLDDLIPLSDGQLDRLSRANIPSSCTSITVDYPSLSDQRSSRQGRRAGREGTRRILEVLAPIMDVLQCLKLNLVAEDSAAILEGMVASASNMQLKELHLAIHGSNGGAWPPFAKRFAGSVTTLGINFVDFATRETAQEAVQALNKWFQSLETLSVRCDNATRSRKVVCLSIMDGITSASERSRKLIKLEVVGVASYDLQRKELDLALEGETQEVWHRCGERFAPSITTLNLRFENCETRERASVAARRLNMLFQSLQLHSLSVTCDDVTESNDEGCLVIMKMIAKVSERSKYLKKLCLDGFNHQEEVDTDRGIIMRRVIRDYSLLFCGMGHSESLEEVALSGFAFKENDAMRLSRRNRSVKKMRFKQCSIEEACLLSFEGLESLALENSTIVPSQLGEGSSTFGNLAQLVSFTFEIDDEDTPDFDDQVSFISSNLATSQSIREVMIVTSSEDVEWEYYCPSLRQLIVNCQASLVLDLCLPAFDDVTSIPFLCAGIEATTSLPSLKLELNRVGSFDAGALLMSFQRNSSLRRLDLRLSLYRDVFDSNCMVGLALREFISKNSSMSTFSYRFYDENEHEETDYAVHLFRGLQSNRTLRVLECDKYLRFTETASSELVNVLRDHNTTLEEVQHLASNVVSKTDRCQIERLLMLNRYGRNFVANAHRVPMDVWGDVLSRIGTEDCNRFVLKLAERAVVDGAPEANPHARELSGRKRPFSLTS